VPLWLCALAVLTLVLRNRSLRMRPGNVPVRLRAPGSTRWRRGHGVWVHDVFVFRAAPAGWDEALLWVRSATLREATTLERRKLHHIGEQPVVGTFTVEGGEVIEVAARSEDADGVLGGFRQSAARVSTPA
jgi:hypothetical protein